MVSLIVDVSKYFHIILITLYAFFSFRVLGITDKRKQSKTFRKMKCIIFLYHFSAFGVLLLTTLNIKLIYLYFMQLTVLVLAFGLYQWIYGDLSKQILYNMLFFISVSFVMLTRLSFDKSLKQSCIIAFALTICLVIPILMDKLLFLSKLGWVYGVVGVVLLLLVLFWGTENYGAINWMRIGGITFQPSEFVKLFFVFGIASLFSRKDNFKQVVLVTGLAGIHVILLVLQKDLGGGLIFFITYVVMLYIATSNPLYFFSGLTAGSVASYGAYHLFDHVKVRVMAWQNPWAYIDKEGYQVSQSLFAIGTGGWFGLGLSKGMPTTIPVVDSDFIFSAIAEESGGIFALFLLLICVSTFVMIIHIAMKQEDKFYKLIAIGFGSMYIFQVFLSVGGVIKFIPSTGVTFPFVSYGGTSILSSIIMFSVIQGLYVKTKVDKKEAM